MRATQTRKHWSELQAGRLKFRQSIATVRLKDSLISKEVHFLTLSLRAFECLLCVSK